MPGTMFGAKLAIELVLLDLVGLAGRTVVAAAAGDGGGRLSEVFDAARWWLTGRNGEGGAWMAVGVGMGVFWLDKLIEAGFSKTALVVLSGTYNSPSSPGEKVKVEQKPSDDVINKVNPSLDQVKSVKVAQCKFDTIQSGVCCCVS